ncbi:MAG: cellobiose phosphorylase, partial [Beijerinckiaceae bacterium]|nr:cellobiose phosphorylase [Beijerinckiaceae bacterium]
MSKRSWRMPRDRDLGLLRIDNRAGLSASVLPNGGIFSLEHRHGGTAVLINQLLGSPVDSGIARIYLRASGDTPLCIEIAGGGPEIRFGGAAYSITWEGETAGLRHRVSLMLHPKEAAWVWQVDVTNTGSAARSADAILFQDIGLGERGFLTNNEAYASQYIDHHIERHGRYGTVLMCRQNLAQGGGNPWAAHGCLDGAHGFATDGMQLFGPEYRSSRAFAFPFGKDLPSVRLQHELACAAIQSSAANLNPGETASWRFFGIFVPDHPEASAASDLARLDSIAWDDAVITGMELAAPLRSLVQDATPDMAGDLGAEDIERLYPERWHEEIAEGKLLSFFIPGGHHNRHVVLRAKERFVTRRHGTLLRSGQAMLPDEATLCATCWMHGVFAAQLTIGNTSFHKLFSVSREPYNITSASGLRIMVGEGGGWQLLTIPSAFEMGLSDCRWIYRLDGRTVIVRAIASGEDPAMQWRVIVEGEPCRFLIFGHLVGGERELESDSVIEVDAQAKRVSLRPGPGSLWGQHYPRAVYHLVTSTPGDIEAIGGDELLYHDGQPRQGAHFALRTRLTRAFCFAAAGSLTDPAAAETLAAKYEQGVADARMLAPAESYWRHFTRNFRIEGGGAEGAAHATAFPWLAHNAMIHLTVPHGLEQYTGAAWGTRDVCQGPVELLLALEHDSTVKEILRIIFAQQYETRGDWPQWFMLEPYSIIQ